MSGLTGIYTDRDTRHENAELWFLFGVVVGVVLTALGFWLI